MNSMPIQKLTLVMTILFLALFLAAMPLLVGADPQPRPEGQAPAATEAPQAGTPAPATGELSLMDEIRAALADGDRLVSDLEQQLRTAPDETAALDLLRAIARQKLETEIAVLEIQARHAQLAGDLDAVAVIRQAIEDIRNPPVPPADPQAMERSAARRPGGDGHD